MTDIHDIKGPYELIDFNYWILVLAAIPIILTIIYFLKNKKGNENQLNEVKKYQKEEFLMDIKKLEDIAKWNFKKESWRELSLILRKFISDNYHKKILFMSFWEISKTKWLKPLKKIFKKLDSELYFYEKKWIDDFLSLTKEIKTILDWLK